MKNSLTDFVYFISHKLEEAIGGFVTLDLILINRKKLVKTDRNIVRK